MAKRKKLATYMDSPMATRMARLVAQGSARSWATGVVLSTAREFDALTLLLDGDAELIELVFIDFRRRLCHEIDGGGGFREGDYLAQGFFAG